MESKPEVGSGSDWKSDGASACGSCPLLSFMKTYTFSGQALEFDETLSYADFWLENGQSCFGWVEWEESIFPILEGKTELDEKTWILLMLLSRWVHEAPRKRYYRNLKKEGAVILSTEFFFEQDGGEEMIESLENSGKVASKVLVAFGKTPMKPIRHDGLDPVSEASLIRHIKYEE